jgi:hypothetical protein
VNHLPSRDHMLETIAERLAEIVLGLDVDYDLAPAIVPCGPAQQPVVAHLLILSCRSPLLSPPRISVSDLIYDTCPADPVLTDSVDKTVGQLLVLRQQMLSRAN